MRTMGFAPAAVAIGLVSFAFAQESPQQPPPPPPAAPAPPAPPPAASRAQEIEKLVQDLADKSFAVRENATRKLERIGAEAVPALEKAKGSPDGEVRDRAEFILERIRDRAGPARKDVNSRPAEDGSGDLKRMEKELRAMKGQVDRLLRGLEGGDGSRPRRLYRSLPDDEFLDMGPGFPPEYGRGLGGRRGSLDDRGYPGHGLGIRAREVDPTLAAHLKLEEGQGVVVEKVLEGSPGTASGLKQHDVVLLLNGKAVSGPRPIEALIQAVQEAPPGKPLPMEVIRGGERMRLEVTLSRPSTDDRQR